MNKFVDNLMSKMTIEEKIGQLNMPNIDGAVITGPVKNTNTGERLRKNEVGALLNLQDVKKIREVQQLALEHSRFKIPLLFGMDVIHGYKTIFPIPLAQAATWNMDMVEEAARISAVEASANGICWTFSPMVDVTRDARWGSYWPRELERIRGLVVRLPKHTCVVIRVTCRLIPIYWLV